MKRIALFLPNWVGDVVMATPAMRAIRQSYPDALLLGLGRPYVLDVLSGNPWFDRIVPIKKRFQPPWQLHRERIDTAVLFPNSFRSALYAWLSRCRRRIGFARRGRSLFLTDRLYPHYEERGRIRPMPILLDYNRLVEYAGAVVRSTQMQLFTTEQDEAAADAVWRRAGLVSHRPVVCLNPGAAFGAAKLWSPEYFAALAQKLVRERQCQILVLCGPQERALARSIAELSRSAGVYSLHREPVSLGLTKACVRRSSLLVTTDSGPRHFAAAFDRPVVALFGPTHIEWTQTFHAREVQLQIRVPCGPCQRRTCMTDHRCMRELTPDLVFSAAIRLLDQAQATAIPEACRAA